MKLGFWNGIKEQSGLGMVKGGGLLYVVYDTFTGANGVTLNNHTPDIAPVGAAWDNNLINIQSNLATLVGANNRQMTVIESGVSDCVITCKLSYGNTTNGTTQLYYEGIIFRYSNSNNYWRAGFNNRADASAYELWEINAGSATLRANSGLTPNVVPGTVYSLKVTINGTGITVLFNNTDELTYTSAFNQTATKHGFSLVFDNLGATMATCDDFTVLPL